jgi:uncharacterized protein (DUF1778 family)
MKDKSKVRDAKIQLRLTTAQLENIKAKAKDENKTMTQLIIEKTLPPKNE